MIQWVEYGSLRKKPIVEHSQIHEEQVEAFMSGRVYFFCENYRCNMEERHCLEYQKSAINNGTQLYRIQCVKCSQGKDIAKKHGLSIKSREPKKRVCKECRAVIEGMGERTVRLCRPCYELYLENKKLELEINS